MSRGIHTSPNQGRSQVWLSPPGVVKALGPFDLDPCCPCQMPWPTARVMWHYDPEGSRGEFPTRYGRYVRDGLLHDFHGRVWLNPPYSATACMAWLAKLADHGRGTALVASRTETEWFFRQIWERASAILFLRGRLHYHYETGGRATGNAGHGSALAAYGEEDAEKLLQSELAGQRLDLRKG